MEIVLTRAEAIEKANSNKHRMSPFRPEQIGEEKDWLYKYKTECKNCGEIIVHSFVPGEKESIMGFPINNVCIRSYGLPGFPPDEQRKMRQRIDLNQPEPTDE